MGLHDFLRGAWQTIRPAEAFLDGWHIRALCEHLEAVSNGTLFEGQEADTLLVNIPPGHMKSLLCCVIWPAWHWSTRPEAKFLFASYSGKFAVRDSIARRSLVQSDWFQRHWRLPLATDENATTKFSNVCGGSMAATSPGGVGTGEHPHFIVVDDPLSAKEANSLASREAVTRWWSGTVTSRGVIHGSRKVIIAQRLHRDDLPGYVLKHDKPIMICLPLEYEGPDRMEPTPLGWVDERTEIGEPLWPEAFNARKIATLKRMSPWDQAAQLQQNPANTSQGAEFPDSYFPESIWFEEWPSEKELFAKVAYLDPSLGKTEKSDLSAIVLLGVTTAGVIYVDADIERRDVQRIAAAVVKAHLSFLPRVFGMESNGFQELLAAPIERLALQSGVLMPTRLVNNHENKDMRIRGLSPYLARTKIKIRNTVGGRELVDQLKLFPQHKFKDGPDALAAAIRLAEQLWRELHGISDAEPEATAEYVSG